MWLLFPIFLGQLQLRLTYTAQQQHFGKFLKSSISLNIEVFLSDKVPDNKAIDLLTEVLDGFIFENLI